MLAALLFWGLTLMPELRGPADGPTIAVSGERFWWRVAYDVEGEPGVVKSLPAGGVESANEIWLPVGRRTEILLGSPDVIHSFWIPAHRRQDRRHPRTRQPHRARPDAAGRLSTASAPSSAATPMPRWACASSPSRRRNTTRMSRRQAEACRRHRRAAAPTLFLKNGCGACHTVRGTPADGAVGPDLTHVASRRTIAAGLLPTNDANIAAFIRTPDHVKPGVEMPAFGMLPDDRDRGHRRTGSERLQ